MNLQPIADRVILKSIESQEKTEGGIILPGKANDTPSMGEVVAVGCGKDDVKMQVKAGDKVIYSKGAETQIEVEGQKYIIVFHNDIIAILG